MIMVELPKAPKNTKAATSSSTACATVSVEFREIPFETFSNVPFFYRNSTFYDFKVLKITFWLL